jgi:hypothetical protein
VNAVRLRQLQIDRDLWSGVVFVAIGIAALALGADLTVGTAAEMGEGYVPRAMAVALLVLGTLLVVLRLWRRAPAAESAAALDDRLRWRPLLFVTTAVLVFALALEPLGVIASIALSATAANFAGQPLGARSLGILVVVLSAFVAIVFVWGLGLPLHLLP